MLPIVLRKGSASQMITLLRNKVGNTVKLPETPQKHLIPPIGRKTQYGTIEKFVGMVKNQMIGTIGSQVLTH